MSTEDKVTCPICLGLFYRPVMLPCAHEFCRECILNAFEHTSFQCPVCRYRLSNWLRKVKNIDSAVDLNKENHLRHLFPDYYREKELGKSPMLSASEQHFLRNINGKFWTTYLFVYVHQRVRAIGKVSLPFRAKCTPSI